MKRTAIAQRGLDFATMFAATHSHLDIGGYTPVLREPSTESTAGGKQATQHLVLMPRVQGEPVYTIGSVNVATKSAKLRTHDCMRQLHELRFKGEPFVFDQGQYQRLFDKLRSFITRQGFQVIIETSPPQTPGASIRPPPQPRGSAAAWLALVLLSLALIGGLAVLMRMGIIPSPF